MLFINLTFKECYCLEKSIKLINYVASYNLIIWVRVNGQNIISEASIGNMDHSFQPHCHPITLKNSDK